jgi:serine/threonine protein kinase
VPALPCPTCDANVELEGATPDACPDCGRSLVVCGEYRIRALLGRGGMATVYEAVRQPGGERVAVKVLVPRSRGDWLAWELFERSTRVLQGLSHPALPTVHAFERGEAARLVLVREVFDGGTLFERIRRDDRRLTPAQVRHLLERLLELLVYLQALVPPVVHRDVKPSNIMFRTPGDWEPVLVDFDTVAPPKGLGSGLTIVGTPGYAAPEQFAATACPASDVYGLGATMLFVVTHLDADDLPRDGGRFDVADRLRGLSEGTAAIIRRMVEPDLERRYAAAADALYDLRATEPGADEPLAEPALPPHPGCPDPREHEIPTLLLRVDEGAPSSVMAGDEAATIVAAGSGEPEALPPPHLVLGEATSHSVIYGDRHTFPAVGHVTAGSRLRLLDRRVRVDCYGEDVVHVQVVTCDDADEVGKHGWLPLRFTDFVTEPGRGAPLVGLSRS